MAGGAIAATQANKKDEGAGNTVTGVMRFDGKSASSGTGGGLVDETSIATFSLTLTKS